MQLGVVLHILERLLGLVALGPAHAVEVRTRVWVEALGEDGCDDVFLRRGRLRPPCALVRLRIPLHVAKRNTADVVRAVCAADVKRKRRQPHRRWRVCSCVGAP